MVHCVPHKALPYEYDCIQVRHCCANRNKRIHTQDLVLETAVGPLVKGPPTNELHGCTQHPQRKCLTGQSWDNHVHLKIVKRGHIMKHHGYKKNRHRPNQ